MMRNMRSNDSNGTMWATIPLSMALLLAGCGQAGTASSGGAGTTGDGTEASQEARKKISDDTDGGHAIEVSGEKKSYSAVDVTKTGEADGDEADFYGENSAVFATEKATLDLSDATITTDGTHANAVFSYGEGTTVNVSDSTIETSGNCSGGLMVTGGGMLNATNLSVHTTGNSSASIRSDRGGGTEVVTGGTYKTEGTGSPAIYSTADVTVKGASLESTASQGVVVEGKNSVTLEDVSLVASNTKKNSDKSDFYQAVMIYQSMSGDASQGMASFKMTGGSLDNKNGDVFFVNNTFATIDLSGVEITNDDESGAFMRLAAAGWGKEGSNGGHVTLSATDQSISGNILVDGISSLNLSLGKGSTFTGAVNPDGASGSEYVELKDGAKWVLSADSHITALTCSADSIDLNGHKLYVGETEYVAGTESTGEAIAMNVTAEGEAGATGMPGDGQEPPARPEGEGTAPTDGQQPPAKPEGEGTAPSGGQKPPAKPDGEGDGTAVGSESGTTGEATSGDANATGSSSKGRPSRNPSKKSSSDASGTTSADVASDASAADGTTAQG